MKTLKVPGVGAARWPSWMVAMLAVVSSLRGVLNDFVYDDIPIIVDNTRVHALSGWLDVVRHPYWPPPFVEQLYRPLSLLFVAVQYTVGHGSPIVFRLVSYALYAAVSLTVLRLGERVLSRTAAFAAAALFAVHPVHVEAVALGVNQSELLVGLIGVVMSIRYIDARRSGTLTAGEWATLGGLYAMACLCKETGFVLPGLLAAAELTVLGPSDDHGRRVRMLPGFALFAGIAISILAIRNAVLSGGAVGVVAANGLAGLGSVDRALMMLQVVPSWLRLLVWPARLQADYVAAEFYPPNGLGIHQVAGLAIVVVFFAAAWVSRRRAPAICFGLLWCALSILPVANIVPTGILLAERTLFLPSVGFLIGGAALGERIAMRWPTTRVQRLLAAVVIVLLAFGLARSVGRQSVWNTRHLEIVTRPPVS